MLSELRVCVLGDPGVGKSSVITSLIKEAFVELPPGSTLPPVTLSASSNETLGSNLSSNLTLILVDTSSRREDRPRLEHELRKANVVLIVYAVDDPQSFERISMYWMSSLRSLGISLPVVLVGNKTDLRSQGPQDTQSLEEEIFPLMQTWKEVETCVECSAKTLANIPETFYFAQRSVLYPTAPLYDARSHQLKPACLRALRRIFKVCDVDKDGLLSNTEINAFQSKCFAAPLQQSELDGVKEVVRKVLPEGVHDDALTEEGFQVLHTIFIQKGRLETTWTALFKFGYGEDLQLKPEFLAPKFDVPQDCAVELTPTGYAFFTDLFQRHDKDQDGALSSSEVEQLFSTSPGNPWLKDGFPFTTITNDRGDVTLQGWLAQWSMTTLLDHRTTLAYLAYLGYQSVASDAVPTTSAIALTATRKSERKSNRSKRQVISALLVGPPGSGKTTLLRSFIGKGAKPAYTPTTRHQAVVNTVEILGAEKYLVVQEFGREEPEILRSAKRLDSIDVILFVFDSADTNSFSYLSNLRQQYDLNSIPTIFVANKSDLDLAVQRHEVQPDVYCRRLRLSPPVAVSWRHAGELWTHVCSAAMTPNHYLPVDAEKIATTRLRRIVYFSTASVIGLVSIGWLYRTVIFTRVHSGAFTIWSRLSSMMGSFSRGGEP